MKTFNQITKLNSNTIMIVDALNMAFSFRGKSNYCDKYISMIESLRKSYKAEKIIITCDSGKSSYRKNIFPNYKANRLALRESQTEQERLDFEAFFQEFTRTIDILKDCGEYPVLQFPGVEADDLAAYIVRKLKKTYNIWLMSSDKDWDLLIDSSVSRFSYVTRKEITAENWNEHYNYDIDQHISIKCLTGDSGDGIPGVPGIGPVKALSLVREYGNTYDIIASLPITSKYKYIASLNEFGADNLLLNYRLMDLVSYCEEAVGEDNIKEIDSVLEAYLND